MSTAVQPSPIVRNEDERPLTPGVSIRPLQETDLSEADRIFRLAFGTFIGLPDPAAFCEGRDFVRSRWLANPPGALAAQCDGELIGSNLVTAWGSVGFFGPLTVRPDFWERSVGKRLLERAIGLFDSWGVRQAGLFTFPQSPKHVGLYQKFGFFPRFLTAVMTKPIVPVCRQCDAQMYSALSPHEQTEALRACRELTEVIFEGLNLESEIRGVRRHQLGDTLLMRDGSSLTGFAVCHCGTEGGESCCYVKFAAVRPGPHAGERFEDLLRACSELAATRGLASIEAGVSTARDDAYRRMLACGFRTAIQGVAMHKPNAPAYHRQDAYVVDDWR